ncbi:membrane protein [Borreliella chilensis]|uniref:Membrane protein n=1 Tax=Borreliella chilensis TaxID=1245910 RepID=A0A0A7UVV5_9SPIR|nr:membrane protein [Borreliella chilensis]
MFRLRRFLNLFYFDFIYNKKFYALLIAQILGMIFISYLLVRFYFNFSATDFLRFIAPKIFILTLIISMFAIYDYYKVIHDPFKNILYFSLPVSSFEHYFFNLIKYLIALPLILIFLYYLGFNILLFLDNVFFLRSENAVYLELSYLSDFLFFRYFDFLSIFSIFIFFRIAFKTHSFVKTLIVFLGTVFLLFSFTSFFHSVFKYSPCSSDLIFYFDRFLDDLFLKMFYSLGFFLYLASYFKIVEFGSVRKKGNLFAIVGFLIFLVMFNYYYLTKGSFYCFVNYN